MATKKQWAAIGMNPGTGSDEEYTETVRNVILRQQEAIELEEDSSVWDAKLDGVSQANLQKALDLIDEAAAHPQYVAAVGQEPVPPEEG